MTSSFLIVATAFAFAFPHAEAAAPRSALLPHRGEQDSVSRGRGRDTVPHATGPHPGAARDTVRSGSITGTVYGGPLGTPLPDAEIAVGDGTRRSSASALTVRSDAHGAYAIYGLAAGTVTMDVRHAGYETASVQVTVSAGSSVRIDLTLDWAPLVLDSVRIEGIGDGHRVASRATNGADGPNVWRWKEPLDSALTSTGEPDLFHALEGDPHLSMRPGSPNLMDRGGASDQLLVRVDGLPVWSPIHSSDVGALGAVSPDAVASVTLHDGALPAAFGDRIAGVLDVDTRDAAIARGSGSIALGPAAARAMWSHAFTIGGINTSVLVAGRHSAEDLSLFRADLGGLHDEWADGIAAASLRFGGATLRLVAVGSGDHAVADDELLESFSPAGRPAVPWHTETVGATWTQQLHSGARLEMRISRAAFGARVPTWTDSLGPTIRSGAYQSEVAAQLSWGTTTVGASVDALALSYRVGQPIATFGSLPLAIGLDADGALGRSPLSLAGSRVMSAAFLEHGWGSVDSPWRITTGMRATEMNGTSLRAEPRIAAAFRVVPGVTASVGVARTHQYIQSLRNVESASGAALGIDLPIAAGMAAAPVAQSDAATIGVVAQLGAFARLTVDGYARRISGLAVASPLGQEAFAVRGFDRAGARVTGMGAELDGASHRLTWQAAFGLGTTIERFSNLVYHSPTQLGQTATLGAGFRLDHATQLRLAGWAATGQPAPGGTALALGRDDGDGGTGVAAPDRDGAGAWIPTSALPAYLRADVEILRTWSVGHSAGRLSTSVTLANVFNHANVTLFEPRAGGLPPTPVTLLPRSLLVGVRWSY